MSLSTDLADLFRRDLIRLLQALDPFPDTTDFSGFITQVNDARGYLVRLILHERDNLEDKAASQQRSPEEVWAETVGDLDLDRSPLPQKIEER